MPDRIIRDGQIFEVGKQPEAQSSRPSPRTQKTRYRLADVDKGGTDVKPSWAEPQERKRKSRKRPSRQS